MSELDEGAQEASEFAERWRIVAPHHDRALRVARARTSNNSDAEDLASEALLKAVAYKGELDASSVGGLISTITMRLAIDMHRRNAAARRLESRCTADTSISFEEQVCDQFEARFLYERVKLLPTTEREVVLHRAAGHNVASTADLIQVSYKSAESAFTRGRVRLRRAWLATLGLIGLLRGRPRSQAFAPTLIALATVPGLVLAISVIITVPAWDWQPRLKSTPIISEENIAPYLLPVPRLWPSSGTPTSPQPSIPPLEPGGVNQLGNARVLETGRIGDRRVVQTGVAVERTDGDKSLQETLAECLAYGVAVSLDNVDCRTTDGDVTVLARSNVLIP